MDGMDRQNGGRGKSRFGPIPVKEGDEYDVTIEGIGEKGDGIAKVQGYVIIVPNVQKGENVKVKVKAVRGKVSFGEVIGRNEAAPAENEDADEDVDEEESEDSDNEKEAEPEEEQ